MTSSDFYIGMIIGLWVGATVVALCEFAVGGGC
jgi:hypothetical protein